MVVEATGHRLWIELEIACWFGVLSESQKLQKCLATASTIPHHSTWLVSLAEGNSMLRPVAAQTCFCVVSTTVLTVGMSFTRSLFLTSEQQDISYLHQVAYQAQVNVVTECLPVLQAYCVLSTVNKVALRCSCHSPSQPLQNNITVWVE